MQNYKMNGVSFLTYECVYFCIALHCSYIRNVLVTYVKVTSVL